MAMESQMVGAEPELAEHAEDMPTILCCLCSCVIKPNPSNMCVQCLRTQVDLTDHISTDCTVYQCSRCLRWMGESWQTCELESRELLALCLKKIQGLKKVKLVDASWVWTEPHSKRLKIKLTVQKEVLNGAILQQSFVVEYTVANQQCDVCQGNFTNMSWKAVVQVRHKVLHKRTFFYLEQLILKNRAHEHCSQIETLPDGMDFFFTERNKSARFVDFLNSVIPIRTRTAKKLVSMDTHNNTTNFKFTYFCEIAKPCKDDVIVIPDKLARNLGNISNLQLVQRVCSSIHLVDPFTLQTAEVMSDKFWHHCGKIESIIGSKQLIEFIVLDVELIVPAAAAGRRILQARSRLRGKKRFQQLADVEVARVSDFGVNDTTFRCVSHLGHLLKSGDTVLGYQVAAAGCREDSTAVIKGELPDIMLVRKKYPKRGPTKRIWKLRSLETNTSDEPRNGRRKGEQDANEADFEQFMDHLASDKELRKGINLYRSKASSPQSHPLLFSISIPLSLSLSSFSLSVCVCHSLNYLSILTRTLSRNRSYCTADEESGGAGATEAADGGGATAAAEDDDEDEYDPEAVDLAELLEDMVVQDGEAGPDEEVVEGGGAGMFAAALTADRR